MVHSYSSTREWNMSTEFCMALVAFLICLTAYTLYKCCYQPYQLFKKHAIPGPTPFPFFGNYFMLRKHGIINLPGDLIKQYGLVSGIYIGRRPVMFIADLEILRAIFVQQFNHFVDRETVPDFFYKSAGLPPGLFVAKGDQWKRSRQSIAPAFSSLNLKMVFPCIENTCSRLKDTFGRLADSGQSVCIEKMYSQFTMECTLAMVFGNSASLRNTSDSFVTSLSILFSAADERIISLLWLIQSHCPYLETISGLALKSTSRGRHFKDIYDACTELVLKHARQDVKNKNILQLMLDANIKENGHTRKLTVKEIVSHIITFLMAGYETTASALGYTSYLLALNPTVQEKLHEEIENYFKNKPDGSLSGAAMEIDYLDMTIQESLRIFPPAPGTTRYCSVSTTVNGVTIPQGTTVIVPTFQLHHSSEYWSQPERFMPERFSAEEKAKRPPFCHMPFGVGPRNCIGSRFAMMEVKMMLIQVLRRYKFVTAPETQIPLETVFRLTVAPKNGIYLRIEER